MNTIIFQVDFVLMRTCHLRERSRWQAGRFGESGDAKCCGHLRKCDAGLISPGYIRL